MAILDDFVEPLAPDYRASLTSTTFSLSSEGPIYLEVGESLTGSITFENTGLNTWTSATRLAPLPRDTASPIWGEDWLSETRVVTSSDRAEPGEQGSFTFSIQGREPGETIQEFSLIEEMVVWFEDDGGVEASDLSLHVIVTEASDPVDTGSPVDTGDTGDLESVEDTGDEDETPSPPFSGEGEDVKGGCACSSGRVLQASHSIWLIGLTMLGLIRRRSD